MIISTKSLGENLRKIREDSGVSQKEAAERCGLDENTVSRIETGKTFPSLRTLVKLAAAIKPPRGSENADDQLFLRIES